MFCVLTVVHELGKYDVAAVCGGGSQISTVRKKLSVFITAHYTFLTRLFLCSLGGFNSHYQSSITETDSSAIINGLCWPLAINN